MVGSISPSVFFTAIPKLAKSSKTSVLPNLVKILLKALPITAPPRAVRSCTTVTTPISSLKEILASTAEEALRFKASERCSELTANFASTAASLSTIVAEFSPCSLKVPNTAVKVSTAEDALIPESFAKFIASAVRRKTFSESKPCLANSFAASLTISKL